jgi:hypothetical protein
MESNAMRARVELTCDCVFARAISQLHEALAFRHANAVSVLEVTGRSSRGLAVDIVVERADAPSLSETLERNGPMSCDAMLALVEQLVALEEEMAAFERSAPHGARVHPVTSDQILLEGGLAASARARVRDLFPYDLVSVDHACDASRDRLMGPFDLAYTIPGDPVGEPASGLRARVYGVALLVYEMLTARRPWDIGSDSTAGLPAQLLTRYRERPPSPRERAPHVAIPAAVEHVLMSALDPSPANRPARPSALAEELLRAART